MNLKTIVGVIPSCIPGTITDWGTSWLHRAIKAEQEGNELIVIEVPKNSVIAAIGGVEESLEMYLRLDAG